MRSASKRASMTARSRQKSSQGAAGALICGVTLQSILARFNGKQQIEAPPEVWLRSVYQELVHIFTLFKGSMNMSAILGLVNTTRGETYYINAEHPRLILYRKKLAQFIEDPQRTPKLGSTTTGKPAHVHYVLLKPGDALFAGSDGKDDLEISGEMDSDDERFPRIVEKAAGNLGNIRQELDKIGARSDDFSLIRIQFG